MYSCKVEGVSKVVKSFRLYLTIILFAFSIVFSIAIAFFDYSKMHKQLHRTHAEKIDMIEDSILQSMFTVDEIFRIEEEKVGSSLERVLNELVDRYVEEPDLNTWDFTKLKEQYNMDIYFIDEQNTIVYSSFQQDIGLNFDECCGRFGKVLKERRLSGKFTHDSLDVEQSTGELKKFGYMPTRDQKYLIEVSHSMKEDEIFQTFSFLEKNKELEREYEPIQKIKVYSLTGAQLGSKDEDGVVKTIEDQFKPAFESVKYENKKKEVVVEENGEKVTHRFIPYISFKDRDYPIVRVIEIVYNEVELEGLLQFYKEEFVYQQIIIFYAAIILAIIVGGISAQPIHYALHDKLTGIKNRAAFDYELNKAVRKSHKKTHLMMLDVDNFKRVNDELGHSEGDRLLVDIANILNTTSKFGSMAARLGGDEFAVICTHMSREELHHHAEILLKHINEVYEEINREHQLEVSVSIGIADLYEDDTVKTFYDHADQALYKAKRNGKNQVQFYEDLDAIAE